MLSDKQKLLIGALAVLGLITLGYLDRTFVQAGLWMFAGLTLTSGFFHGALDIVLMQREFASVRRFAGVTVFYAAAVVLLAILCAHVGWLMLLLLLSMSVWHFGEPYGRWAQGDWVQRVIAGGAPVMLPALLSAPAVRDLLPMAVGLDATWAWTIWQTMAWLWVGLCGFAVAAYVVGRQRQFCKPLWQEVGLVLVLNLALSPLMAFSLYFGALHAAAHIFRVVVRQQHGLHIEQTNRRHRGLRRPGALAILLTCAATFFLLLPLVWYLQSASLAASALHGLLNGLLVALTAVTLPHLILVSRNADWLAGLTFTKRSKA